MKLNELLLLSGNDIPFNRGVIHPPRLKEIALIGEEDFLIGCHFLNFNKKQLSIEDKNGLENQSDFNIFMSVMNSHEKARHKTDSLLVLTLLFPEYEVKIEQDKILLQNKNFSSNINEQNYEEFKDILTQIICLEASEEDNYDPADAIAAKIAEKIKKGRAARAQSHGEDIEKIALFSRYVSILSVGEKKDMNILMNYTIYQLMDEYKRFILKEDSDIYLKAKLAGAENLEEAENWMKDIHP